MSTAPKNNLEEDKQQPSLMPLDVLMDLLEPAYREGLIKYRRESWREGFFCSDMFDATMRHLIEFYYNREDLDSDAKKLNIKKHHLGAAIFSIICMYQSITTRPELDNRPSVVRQNKNGKE